MNLGIELRTLEGQEVAIVAFDSPSVTNTEEIKAACAKINKFIDDNHPQKIVIDFENVKFFSSEVLGTIVAVRAKLNSYGGEVVISAINPQLYRVFKITNLDKIFKFYPDLNSAVQTIKTS
jgi:anti-sigma B factor antagonist